MTCSTSLPNGTIPVSGKPLPPNEPNLRPRPLRRVLIRTATAGDWPAIWAFLREIDAGPLKRAREIEAFGYLHAAIQQPLGTGFSTTVKILS
jgi:hypothetical protein